MADLIYSYVYGNVEWLVKNGFFISLLAAYVPFGLMLKKRRKFFILRLFIVYTVIFLVSNLYIVNTLSAMVILYDTLYYVTIIALFIAGGLILYKVSFWDTLFCGTGMLALQQVSNKICTVIISYLGYFYTFRLWLNIIIYWTVLIGADIVVYFIYSRNREHYGDMQSNNISLVLMTSVLSIITVVLNTVGLFPIRFLQTVGLNEINLTAIISAMICIISVVVLIALFNSASNKKLESDVAGIVRLWEADRKNYELSKQYIDQINIKYHDLKYALGSALKNKRGLKDVNECIKAYDTFVETGNETLDVLINEKSILCNNLDIQLACITDGSAISHLNPVDIYSLLGNAIDNAIEAVKNFNDNENKYIVIMMRRSGDMAVIGIENPIKKTPVFKNGLPQTSKPDKENHGLGLKSMKMIVEKYKGFMSINTENNTFSLQIALPIVK